MSYSPRKATLSDIPSIIEAYFDAFDAHPVTLRVFNPSSSSSVQTFWTKWLTADLQDPNVHYYVITDPTSTNPEHVFAFGKWRLVLPSQSTPSPGLPTFPDGADLAFAKEVFGLMDTKHAAIMQNRPHWYLEMLGVRKEFQRKGAGKTLLKLGLQKADEEGVEAYLTASPAGTPLYLMNGFEVVETVLIDEGRRVENFMVRRPGVKS